MTSGNPHAETVVQDPVSNPPLPSPPLLPTDDLEFVQRLAGVGMLTTGVAQELASLLSLVTTANGSIRNEIQKHEAADEAVLRHYSSLIDRHAYRCAQIAALLGEYGAQHAPRMAVTDSEVLLRDALLLVERQFLEGYHTTILVSAPAVSHSIVCDHNRIVQCLINLLYLLRSTLPVEGGLITLNAEVQHDTAAPEPFGSLAIAMNAEGELPDTSALAAPLAWWGASLEELGLQVARQIADQHNGRIWLENNNGPTKGATVTLLLPLRPSA